MTTPAHPIIYSNTVEYPDDERIINKWYIDNTVHDLLNAEDGFFSIIKKIHHTTPTPSTMGTGRHITVVFIDYSKIAYYYENPSYCGFQWAAPEPTSSGRGCEVDKPDQIACWFLTTELRIPRSYLLSRLTDYLDESKKLRKPLLLDNERQELASRCPGDDYVDRNESMRYLMKAEYKPEWTPPDFIKDLIERARIKDLIERARSARGDLTSRSVRKDDRTRRRDDTSATRPRERDERDERGERGGGRKLSTRKLSTRKLSKRKLSTRKLSTRKLSTRKLSKRKLSTRKLSTRKH